MACLAITVLLPEAWGQKQTFAVVEPNAGTVNSSAEVYDPASGHFAATAGGMHAPRQGHVAVLLASGKVLLAGGASGTGFLDSAETYDPSTGVFTLTSESMETARSGHVGALLKDGTVLVAGGYSSYFLSSAEIYSPSSDGFRTISSTMISPRMGATATVLSDGKVLITGGYNSSYLTSAEIYDPDTQAFTATTGSMNAARMGHTATLLTDGKVLVTGGQNPDYLNTAEIYDPGTGNFTTTTGNLNAARNGHTASRLPDGKVLIAGGYNGRYLSSAEIYDPGSGRFTTTSGSLKTSRTGHAAVGLEGGKVLLCGGFNGSHLDSAELFDPANGSFTAQPEAMTAVRQSHSATVMADGRVLIAGGQHRKSLKFDVNIEPTDNVSPNIVFAADSKSGFVPYTGSGIILVFSPETGEVLHQITTGGYPAYGTLLSDGKTLAYVSVLDNRVFIVDMEEPALRSTFTFAGAQFGFGSVITVAPDGRQAYISSTGTGTVLRFNLADGKETGRLTGLEGPAQITLSLDGGMLVVVDTMAEELVFADTSSMTRKYTIKSRDTEATADLTIFNKPVLSGDGSSGIVAMRDLGGSLSPGKALIFRTSTGEVLDTREIGSLAGFTGITPDGSTWVILNEHSLSLIPVSNPESMLDISTVQGEPLGSANVAFTADSKYGFYASSAQDMVYQHDLVGTGVVGQYRVGDNPNLGLDQPAFIAITPDGKTVAVLEFMGNRISLLSDVTVVSSSKFIISGNQFSGLSLINLSDVETEFSIYALDSYGQTITADNLENPAVLDLGPNAQISLNVSELFDFDMTTDHEGRLLIYADQPRVAGYVTVGQIAPIWLSFYLNRMDGTPLFQQALHDFVIPEIPVDSGHSAQLNFVNPNYSTGAYDLKHFAKDGTPLETSEANSISGQNRQEQSAGDLFATSAQGNVLLTGGQPTTSTGTTNSADIYDSNARSISATGTMVMPRQFHTATTLANGKVLIAGGKNGNTILSSAETYDIAAGVFASTADSMLSDRQRHTATVLLSGKVLIAGGQNSVAVNNTAEIYDPTTDIFTPTAGNMTTPRDGHTATLLLSGKVLLAGGLDGNAVSHSAEIFDPNTGAFTPVGNMTAARVFHTATRLPNGRVLIAGGYDGSYLSTAEVFDPVTETFKATSRTMAAARSAHTATLLSGGGVLIAGGLNGDGPLSSAEIYDPGDDAFAAVAGVMTDARSSHTATLLPDGLVLIAGGTGEGDDEGEILKTVEKYDPDTQTFTIAGSMAEARTGHAAALMQSSGGGYVRVTSTPGLYFTEYFGSTKTMGALNGIDIQKYTGVTRLYAAQFANTSSFKTVLNLINANADKDAEVTLTIHAPDGRVLGKRVTQTLVRNGQLRDNLDNIFQQDAAIQNATGWLQIESTADQVVGAVSYIDSDETYLASVELSGRPLDHFVFPMAAEDSVYQTGIALLNSNDEAATVTVEFWEPEGARSRSATVVLPPGTRTALYLSDYFPGFEPHLLGNIRVYSDRAIHGLSLINDRKFHFLAAIPPIPIPDR